MTDGIRDLLFTHLPHGLGDAEVSIKLVDVWALLREHLAHLEDLLAQVVVFIVLVGIFGYYEGLSHQFHT